jgi:hypothetical protein
MSATNYLEDKFLLASLNGNTYTGTANVYVALYSTAPTDAGGGTELSGSGYSRQEVVFSVDTGNGVATNTGNIAFYNPTSKEVTYSSTVSTAGNVTAGNLIASGNLFFGSTRFTPKVQVLTRASGNVAVTVSLS